MMWISVLSCVWLLFLFVDADNNTFTYDMALRCKEHLCQHGYSYETFYRLDSLSKRPKDPEIIFEMHIAILAASNGHILLSTVSNVQPSDPVYEIVVGGGANKFTELRRNVRKNARASAKTYGILSPIEFRSFYIRIKEDGVIEFGKEGDILPIISYMDHDPISINYFSFAAWNGVEAKFLYDCPAPGEKKTEGMSPAADSTEVERVTSNYDNLMRTLFWYRDPFTPPALQVSVDVGLHVTSVSYDEMESIINVGASILLKWSDNSLAWNPNKFNGTTYLTLRQGQVWTPVLHPFDDTSGIGPKISEPVTIVHSGEATLHMQVFIKSWCSIDNGLVTKWPHDEFECNLMLEPWEVHDKILLKLMEDDNKEMKTLSDIQDVVVNAYEVDVQPSVIKSTAWNYAFLIDDDNTTHQSDRIIVSITMKRRYSIYNMVFNTPLIVLVVFFLMSFWTEPLQMERIRLYTCCVIIICLELCYIDYLIPSYTTPSILVLYLTVLGEVILAILIQVALMTSLAERVCRTTSIQNILMLKLIRNLFCLRESRVRPIYVSINEDYSAQDGDGLNEIVPKNDDIEEMQQDTNKDNTEKMEVVEVIDKFLFVVYTTTFAVMLVFHY